MGKSRKQQMRKRRRITVTVLLLILLSVLAILIKAVILPAFTNLSNSGFPNLSNEKNPKMFGIAKNKNIIVFQVEAFQNLCIGRSLFGQEITPNLNKLIKENYYFKNGISQIAEGNTSDAEFMLNTSIYPTLGKSPFKEYTNKDYTSLPKLLKENGYYTATFHTNEASFWNRENMYPALGFDKFYDRNFFGTDEFHFFGSSDHILYTKAIEELKKFKDTRKPFYANFITLSSHAFFRNKPFMNVIEFGGNYDKAIVGRYLAAINYTDRQLGLFMDTLKKEGLYDNSIILIYGDHFALTEANMKEEYSAENKKMIETLLGRSYDSLDYLNIPVILKLPQSNGNEKQALIPPQTFEMPAGQIDFMPTILNLAGIKNIKGTMFGQDLFNTEKNSLGVRFYMPYGTIINEQGLFSYGEYHIGFDHVKNGETAPAEEIEKMKALLSKSDSYLLGLPNR